MQAFFRAFFARASKRRRRAKRRRDDVLQPYIPSFRRLEDRRVFDVGATFTSATGQLDLLIHNSPDTANVSVSDGEIIVTDAQNQRVEINIDGAGTGPVRASGLTSIRATGDSAPSQQLALHDQLDLPGGLFVNSEIERAVLRASIEGVQAGPVRSDALETELHSTISTTGQSIVFGGDTIVAADASLAAFEIVFLGRVDSAAGLPQSLTLDAGAGSVLFYGDIGGRAALRQMTVVHADSGIFFGPENVSTQHGNGTVARLETVDGITIGSAERPIAGGIVINAGPDSALEIATSGGDVTLFGSVVLRSDLSIDTGLGTGDIRFQSGSVESQADETNGVLLNAGGGMIGFGGDLGSVNAIGSLIIVQADGGVVFGSADTVQESTGEGPVTTIRSHGLIDIGVGENEIGGRGIVLNGGIIGNITVTSLTAGLRFNGPLILATDVSMAAAGDLLFTNDSPVDSQFTEFNDLLLEAGRGISLNENIGAIAAIGSLTVVRAPDGLTLGGATAEIPGSGGNGPVSIVNTEGAILLGRDEPIGGAGIVLSGTSGNGQSIFTSADEIAFHGAVSLVTDVAIDTSGGEVLFTNAASIDGATDNPANLFMNAGDAAIRFNEDIGAIRPIGSLTVGRADGGVWFGGAPSETTGTEALGPVEEIHLTQGMGIGLGLNEVIGGIHFQGGFRGTSITAAGLGIRMHGPVHLESDLSISTGGSLGDVFFTSSSTIDSSDGAGTTTTDNRSSVTIDAARGRVLFNADIGSRQPIDRLDVVRAASIVFGGADTVTAGGSGPVNLIRTDGEIDLGSGPTSGNQIGSIFFNGGPGELVVETSSEIVRVNGAVLLGSAVRMDSRSGNTNLVFTEAATIDSQVDERNSFQIDLSAGNASFLGAIGNQSPLGQVSILSANDITFGSFVAVQRIHQQQATGTTVFQGQVHTSDPTLPGLELNGGSFVFHDEVIATGQGTVFVEHRDMLDIRPEADFRLDGGFFAVSARAHVRLGGNIATSGDTIVFNGSVQVSDGNPLLSTVAGDVPTGANILFAGVLSAQSRLSGHLTLNTGSSGDLIFQQNVGDLTPLGELTVVSARDVQVDGRLEASAFHQLEGFGTTVFADVVELGNVALPALRVNTENIRFQNTVTTTGEGSVILVVGELLELAPGAHFTLSGSFTQSGSGAIRSAANIVSTGQSIIIDGRFTLADNVLLQVGERTGLLRLNGAIDGISQFQQTLRLTAPTADVVITGNVGENTPLQSLTIANAHDTRLEGTVAVAELLQVAGNGNTQINGEVTALIPGGRIEIHNRSLTINGELNGRDSFVMLDAIQDIQANATIQTNDTDITIEAGNDVALSATSGLRTRGGTIAISADDDRLGTGAILMADGVTVETELGAITVFAGEDITLGRLISPQTIRIESLVGGVRDGGDVGGANVDSPALFLQTAAGVGTDNPLETRINTLAAVNTGPGGIRIDNQLGNPLKIGQVDELTGLSDGGSGLIEILNVGAIDVAARILNQGGGNTILETELAADITVEQPIQNLGGDGSILLRSGGNIVIHHSLPEPNPNTPIENPEGFFELLTVGEGAVRVQAAGRIDVQDGPENYAIIRTSTGQFTNIPPIVTIETLDQGGADIDFLGRGIVQVTLGDRVHPEMNYQVTIDWGDGQIEHFPIAGRGDRLDSGNGQPGVYQFAHRYFANPNLSDPSAPIPIRVEVRYDPRASGDTSIDATFPPPGSGPFNGIRFFENTSREVVTTRTNFFTLPGTGGFGFIKVVESVIVPVEAQVVPSDPPIRSAPAFTTPSGVSFEPVIATFEVETQELFLVFMRVVDDVTGNILDEIPLDPSVLDDPVALFHRVRFPNGHFQILLEELSTNRIRVILDVHVYNGRVVPPNFREGAADRPVGAEPPDSSQP